MRYTLLEMVQEILGSMDSDEVNSIDDTVESWQVANLIKGVYYDLAVELGLPEHEGAFELDASGDVSQPTLMTVPNNVVTLRSIAYDQKLSTETYKNYQPVSYLQFPEFMERQQGLRSQTTGVGEMLVTSKGTQFSVMYSSDQFPIFYTTIDDRQIIFDAYNGAEDTTLQKEKTLCQGSTYSTFLMEDTFTPDLDAPQFSYFRNRAKVRAFAELKQAENAEATYEARRQKIIVQKRKRTVPDYPEVFKVARYGRSVGTTWEASTIPKFLKNGD